MTNTPDTHWTRILYNDIFAGTVQESAAQPGNGSAPGRYASERHTSEADAEKAGTRTKNESAQLKAAGG